MDNIKEKYRQLNDSFKKTMVYRVGIDAGFFTEYTFMLHAMLYCQQHHIRFVLYSKDANFGIEHGWTDYFEPFCDEVQDSLHRKYNRHRIPSWGDIIGRCRERCDIKFLKWKLKGLIFNLIGRVLCYLTYGHRTLLNADCRFRVSSEHFFIPELDIDGDYQQAITRLHEVVWHFNAETQRAVLAHIDSLHLPDSYGGCQIRGGDKITEVSLITSDIYVDEIRKHSMTDMFVLTDDYRLYSDLKKNYPQINWFTLCAPSEVGYVNSSFTNTAKSDKRKQMERFFASMQILKGSTRFFGSVTSGPSLFLLKILRERAIPVDFDSKNLMVAFSLPIKQRGILAEKYLRYIKSSKRNN